MVLERAWLVTCRGSCCSVKRNWDVVEQSRSNGVNCSETLWPRGSVSHGFVTVEDVSLYFTPLLCDCSTMSLSDRASVLLYRHGCSLAQVVHDVSCFLQLFGLCIFNSVNPCIALLLLRHWERWLPCTVNTINMFYYVVWRSWSIVFCSFIVCRK